MSQYIVDAADVSPAEATAILRGEEAHHLSRVTRAREGEKIALFDGAGWRWGGEIARIGRDEVLVAKIAPLPPNEPEHPVILAAGLIKADRWEWMLEKAVELGVTTIIPLLCSRSQPGDVAKKSARWSKIILSAAKQCERGRLPELRPPATVEAFVASLGAFSAGERRWLFIEREKAEPPTISDGPQTLAIGPEGAFSDGEARLFLGAGFVPATLGARILRSETAALAALSLLGGGKNQR